MLMKELVREILNSLAEYPESWSFDRYNARCGQFVMWIANRPYADLRLGEHGEGPRIGDWWSRRKLRKAMDAVTMRRDIEAIQKFLDCLIDNQASDLIARIEHAERFGNE